MKRFLLGVLLFCCLGTSFAGGFNVGATAYGNIFNMLGLDKSEHLKIFPGSGGMGGGISADVMFPFVADLSVRTGVAAEYRDFRGYESIDSIGWKDDVILSQVYLEFPILLRTKASPTVDLEGGTVLGMNLMSKYYGPAHGEKWVDLDEIQTFELGFSANLILQMTDNVEMTLRVAYMITDVLDKDEVDFNATSQTFKFQAGLTYWIGGGLAPLEEPKK